MGQRVGILAVQGDVEAHANAVRSLGADAQRVLCEADLCNLDALVLPGGESTTISKGIARLNLWEGLRSFVEDGRPVLGTCAGAILLAREVENHPVGTLGAIDVVAIRNAYGTQVNSFAARVDQGAAADLEGLRCVFIRAPRFRDPGPGVEILARVDGEPVFMRQGRVMVCAFHPELTEDTRVHQLLLAD